MFNGNLYVGDFNNLVAKDAGTTHFTGSSGKSPNFYCNGKIFENYVAATTDINDCQSDQSLGSETDALDNNLSSIFTQYAVPDYPTNYDFTVNDKGKVISNVGDLPMSDSSVGYIDPLLGVIYSPPAITKHVFSDLTPNTDTIKNDNPIGVSYTDSNGVSKTINSRFDLIEFCNLNKGNSGTKNYRCFTGDLNSSFFFYSDLTEQELSDISEFIGDSDSTSDGKMAGLSGNHNNFTTLNDYADPSLKSGDNDICNKPNSSMAQKISAHKASSQVVGVSSYYFGRDFNGSYRRVRTAAGAFETPIQGINCQD